VINKRDKDGPCHQSGARSQVADLKAKFTSRVLVLHVLGIPVNNYLIKGQFRVTVNQEVKY